MARSTVEVKLSVRFAWWVQPYLYVAAFNQWAGIPVNVDRIVETVMRGVKCEVLRG